MEPGKERKEEIPKAAPVVPPRTKGRMLRSFLKGAVLVLGIAVLVVEGYYLYRLYGDLAASPDTPGITVSETTVDRTVEAENTTPDETTIEETTAEPDQSVFVHRAAPENIVGNSTYLDHPLTNANPGAVVSVTRNWNPRGEGGVYNDHPIGVWYDTNRQKWAIYNEDRVAMPDGVAFNVVVWEGPTEAR